MGRGGPRSSKQDDLREESEGLWRPHGPPWRRGRQRRHGKFEGSFRSEDQDLNIVPSGGNVPVVGIDGVIQRRGIGVALQVAAAGRMRLGDVRLMLLPEARHILCKHGKTVATQEDDDCGHAEPKAHGAGV